MTQKTVAGGIEQRIDRTIFAKSRQAEKGVTQMPGFDPAELR
jgi:hypothetical protein